MKIKEDNTIASNYSVIEIQDKDRTQVIDGAAADEIRMGVHRSVMSATRVVVLAQRGTRLWIEEDLLLQALVMLNEDQKSGRELK